MTSPDLPDSDDALAPLLREALRDPAAPPQALARAIALRSPLREAARQAVAAVRRLIAVPVFDAAGGFAAAAGVRSAGPGSRQLLFRAEACEVDVRISALGATWTVAGQVFGVEGAREVVLTNRAGSCSAELGPTSEFAFAGLAADAYELVVRTPAFDLVVPGLEVGAARP